MATAPADVYVTADTIGTPGCVTGPRPGNIDGRGLHLQRVIEHPAALGVAHQEENLLLRFAQKLLRRLAAHPRDHQLSNELHPGFTCTHG